MHFPLSLSFLLLAFPRRRSGGSVAELGAAQASPELNVAGSRWCTSGRRHAGAQWICEGGGAVSFPPPPPSLSPPPHRRVLLGNGPGAERWPKRGGGSPSLPPRRRASSVALMSRGSRGLWGGGVAEDDSGGGHGGGGPRSGRRRPRGWRGSRRPQGPSHLELPLQRGSELMVVASPVAGALPLPSDARGSLSPLPFDTRISLSPISSSTGANRGDGPRSARPQPHGHALLPRPFTDEECVAKIGYANLGWSRRKPS